MKLLKPYLFLTALATIGLITRTQLLTLNGHAGNPPIPQEIYGQYAPSGLCSKDPVVDVSAKGLFINYRGQKRGPLPVDVCYSCAGGAQYNGIQRWVSVKEGRDRWGGTSPVTLMFHANEKQGRLEATNPGPFVAPVSSPLEAVVKAGTLQLCPPTPKPKSAENARNDNPNSTASQIFAKSLIQLMSPFSVPRDSFYDWRYLEKSPEIQGA